MKKTIKRINQFIEGFKYLVDQLFKRSNEELAKELESLYAEHADLVKKQNLLYEKLAEIEKKQGETNEKRKCNSRSDKKRIVGNLTGR